MEVPKGKGGIYPLALLFVMLTLYSYCCGAAVLVQSNTSTVRCNGRLGECLIEDDLELEFLMNPYINRLLATKKTKTDIHDQLNPDRVFCDPHGRNCGKGCRGEFLRTCNKAPAPK